MKRYPIFFGMLFLLISVFACYDENNSFGKNWTDTAFRNIMVDTCTISITSTTIDSVETNGKGISLAGCYTHPLWGTFSAATYLPYTTPNYATDADESVRLDSVVLAMGYNSYSIGDTTQPLRFHIHRLLERVIANENNYIYNNASFRYDPTPLASYTFVPNSREESRIEIRLPDEFGLDMLERLHTRDGSVEGDNFQDYLKGLVIVPDESCQSVLSFAVNDTSSVIVLRYGIENQDDSHIECTITPDTDTQFYHIEQDRSGTLLADFPSKNIEVGSSELDNRGLLFGGIGWYSTLSFPHLNNILQLGKQVSIESAYLKIYPEPGTWTEYNPLPDSLYLYIVDENNVVTDAVTDYLGEEVQHATLMKDPSIVGNNYYYFDITTFMQEELGAFGMYKHSLRLVFNDESYTQSLQNLTFKDQTEEKSVNLQLTFKVYESY